MNLIDLLTRPKTTIIKRNKEKGIYKSIDVSFLYYVRFEEPLTIKGIPHSIGDIALFYDYEYNHYKSVYGDALMKIGRRELGL